MGTPVPDPIPGVNCLNWDPPAETPKYIYVMYYDVKKGDLFGAFEPPNLHIFKMEQRDGLPCHWQYRNTAFGWETYLGIDAGQFWIWLKDLVHVDAGSFIDIKDFSPPAEYELFTNDYQAPAGNWGYNGHAIIFWSDPFVVLPTLLGLDQFDDLMLETFSDSNNDLYFKYCSLKDRVNIVIKIPR